LSACKVLSSRRDDREQIAADPGHRWLDHGEDRRGRNRGVNRIAVVLQHLQARG
jgi:hypothetical protein